MPRVSKPKHIIILQILLFPECIFEISKDVGCLWKPSIISLSCLSWTYLLVTTEKMTPSCITIIFIHRMDLCGLFLGRRVEILQRRHVADFIGCYCIGRGSSLNPEVGLFFRLCKSACVWLGDTFKTPPWPTRVDLRTLSRWYATKHYLRTAQKQPSLQLKCLVSAPGITESV